MQVGTVRREALRLMFAAYADLLDEPTAQLYENTQYAPYLADMEMCINRAMQRMSAMGLLVKRIPLAEAVVTDGLATYNLAAIADFEGVVGVIKQDADGLTAQAYQWAGGTTLVVPYFSASAVYVLLYRPIVTPLAPMCPDDTPIPLPEGLACLLPYYIKSELYEEEDAVAASRARNYFEAGLNAWPHDEVGVPPLCTPYDSTLL